MNGYLNIKQIILPTQCIKNAYEHLRHMGKQGFEGVALFAGREYGDKFSITHTIIPKQVAMSIEYGLLYSVPGDELHRLNVFLYENELSLIAQIHSHPQEAYHSVTDDASPIVTTIGSVSIVVPDFAIGPIKIESWAVYQLSENNIWEELDKIGKTALIEIN